MTNLAIAYINRADSATLTASPVAGTSTPVTYLQNDARGYQFAATAAGAQDIKGTWGGTAYAIGCVRLDRTNLADGDTWRIQLYSDAAWTTGVYDSGTIAVFTAGTFASWSFSVAEKLFTEVAGVKSFKITVTSAAVFQSSRLFVGTYTNAQYNPKLGLSAGWDGNSTQVRKDGGSLGVNVKSQWRTMSFDMFASTETERAIWNEIGRYAGNTKTVWVSVFPGVGGTQERDYSVMGKFEKSPAQKITQYTQYDFSLTLNEV